MTDLKPAILVVDDDTGILDSFETFLKNNYEILITTTGEDALNIITEIMKWVLICMATTCLNIVCYNKLCKKELIHLIQHNFYTFFARTTQ